MTNSFPARVYFFESVCWHLLNRFLQIELATQSGSVPWKVGRNLCCINPVAHWENELLSPLCPLLSALCPLDHSEVPGQSSTHPEFPCAPLHPTLWPQGVQKPAECYSVGGSQTFQGLQSGGKFCLGQNISIIFLMSFFSFPQIKTLRKYWKHYEREGEGEGDGQRARERLKMRTLLGSQKFQMDFSNAGFEFCGAKGIFSDLNIS